MTQSIPVPNEIGRLYPELIVILGSIPVAAFLSSLDCAAFIRTLTDRELQDCRVVSNQQERDCFGESVSGETFLNRLTIAPTKHPTGHSTND